MEYYIIIAASIIIILSYLFNWISIKTNFPSVLLLILFGMFLRQASSFAGPTPEKVVSLFDDLHLLELLGTLGLIFIVLEAALDLKVEKGKLKMIGRAFFSAFGVLLVTVLIISYIIIAFMPQLRFVEALIYATPLSILSSAVVIPSVENLSEDQKEFHVYDSTFSDILGIVLFYFLLNMAETDNNAIVVGDFSMSLVLTVVVSVVLSYGLLYIFQKLEAKVKLFLITAILMLLFSVGKLMHLSSLIIILIFGLILSNHRFFFSGKLQDVLDREKTDKIYESFHVITMESAFVIRTFFFVIFGFTVLLSSLFDPEIALISGLILVSIYLVRGLLLKLLLKKNIALPILIAPRGLITLLLFYSIPEGLKTPRFDQAILLFTIIVTSLLMSFGLIRYGQNASKKKEPVKEEKGEINELLQEEEQQVK